MTKRTWHSKDIKLFIASWWYKVTARVLFTDQWHWNWPDYVAAAVM